MESSSGRPRHAINARDFIRLLAAAAVVALWLSWDKPFENAKIWHRMILNCDLKEIIFIMKKIILLHISDAFHFSNILVTSK